MIGANPMLIKRGLDKGAAALVATVFMPEVSLQTAPKGTSLGEGPPVEIDEEQDPEKEPEKTPEKADAPAQPEQKLERIEVKGPVWKITRDGDK